MVCLAQHLLAVITEIICHKTKMEVVMCRCPERLSNSSVGSTHFNMTKSHGCASCPNSK